MNPLDSVIKCGWIQKRHSLGRILTLANISLGFFSSRSIVILLANPLPSKIYLLKLLKFALNVVCPMRTSSSWKGLNLNLQHRQFGSALSLQNPSVCISCPTHNGLLFKTLVHLDQLNLIHSIYFIFLPFSDRFLRLFASKMSNFPNHQLDFSTFHLQWFCHGNVSTGTCSCEGTSPLNCWIPSSKFTHLAWQPI